MGDDETSSKNVAKNLKCITKCKDGKTPVSVKQQFATINNVTDTTILKTNPSINLKVR